MPQTTHSLFLAGDALITAPWSGVDDQAFLALVDEMRAADTTILNLETLIHEYKGYAQADSGGAWMASPPEIAGELMWAGVDMVSHANNHAFDYGPEGILETHEHIDKAGITIAGTGKDLQAAREPRYVTSGDGEVALVSMTSTFTPYGVASFSRPDLHGRPGLNPLTLLSHLEIGVSRWQANLLGKIAALLGRRSDRYGDPRFFVLGVEFVVGEGHYLRRGPRLLADDARTNLASIKQAAAQADITVVAIHAHRQGEWLGAFSRQAIEKGADVVLAHGPHEVRGIEMHLGKPIFYSMGDFVYQTDQISRVPAEAYIKAGIDGNATIEEYRAHRRRHSYQNARHVYEGIAANLEFTDGEVAGIRLIPIDLQFDAEPGTRGRPRWADAALGERILARVIEMSAELGTTVTYSRDENYAVVNLPG